MIELTDPDRLLRLDSEGREIGHNICAQCRHDRFVTEARAGAANAKYRCARCGCEDFAVVMGNAQCVSARLP